MGLFGNKKDQEKKKKAEEEKQQQLQQEKEEEREKNIAIAARFLANPQTSQVPKTSKVKFLKDKGLSQEDIDVAYQRYHEEKEQQKKQVQEEQEKQQKLKEEDQVRIQERKELEELRKQKEMNQIGQKNLKKEEKDLVDIQSEKPALESEVLMKKVMKAKENGRLILNKINLTEISHKIFELTNLQRLIIISNPIDEVPQEISRLVNLQIVHFKDCGLTNIQIQPELWDLNNITELNLSNNKLNTLEEVVKLTNLKKLEANDNEIQEIPSDINQLQNLQTLNLSHNKISYVPKSLGNLNALNRLNLTGNLLDVSIINQLQTPEGLKQYQQSLLA